MGLHEPSMGGYGGSHQPVSTWRLGSHASSWGDRAPAGVRGGRTAGGMSCLVSIAIRAPQVLLQLTAEAIKILARAHQSLVWARQRHVNALRSALREFCPGARPGNGQGREVWNRAGGGRGDHVADDVGIGNEVALPGPERLHRGPGLLGLGLLGLLAPLKVALQLRLVQRLALLVEVLDRG